MHFMCLQQTFTVDVPYRTSNTISDLLDQIKTEAQQAFIDPRITDEHFPEDQEGVIRTDLELVSFNHWWKSKEDVVERLRIGEYVPGSAAELLALRQKFPSMSFTHHIVALSNPWNGKPNYHYAVCLNGGTGYGLKLRTIESGWAPFYSFLVKKIESG